MSDVTFSIDKSKILNYQKGDIDEVEFLWSVLGVGKGINEQDPEEIIADHLLSHEQHDGGAPDIGDLTIVEAEIYGLKGFVTFEYNVSFYYGCADLSPIEEKSERINFTISIKREEITFHFVKPEPRTTKEEF